MDMGPDGHIVGEASDYLLNEGQSEGDDSIRGQGQRPREPGVHDELDLDVGSIPKTERDPHARLQPAYGALNPQDVLQIPPPIP